MQGLRVAIVHYHLRPGGVTRVIEHALRSLSSHAVRAVVVCGESAQTGWERLGDVRVVEGLGYTDAASGRGEEDITSRLRDVAAEALGAQPDVWHIHNHSLGKNAALPAAVARLAEEGDRLLLQMHDFAEDGRPGNYRFLMERLGGGEGDRLGERLYPCGAHVHYAVINERDMAFLRRAGVGKRELHFLANALNVEEWGNGLGSEEVVTDNHIYLYVTRAIRRKNLGEFLLWSVMGKAGERFEVSRAPKNPSARRIYDRWVAFARSLNLPVEFEVGARRNVGAAQLMSRAHALVSTSVAEGFGLAFLEPWAAGRAMLGRGLPEVTGALRAAGLDLSHLYSRLDVPLEWIGRDVLRRRFAAGMERSLAAYGRGLTRDAVERALSAAVCDEMVDFGRLDEEMQEGIIRRLAASAGDRRCLRPERLEPAVSWESVIEANRDVARREFSLERYGERLMEVYNAVAESGASETGCLNSRVLLDGFLAPERFMLLRAG